MNGHDAAGPLPRITPPELTIAAFDRLGTRYERAFRGLAALDAALDRAGAPGS